MNLLILFYTFFIMFVHLLCVYVHKCVFFGCVCACVCTIGTHVELGDNSVSQWNSDHQAWQLVPFPTEPSCWPLFYFVVA